MKFLVCGGRDFGHIEEEKWFIIYWLNELILNKYDNVELIHGAAKGVDSIAGYWAEMNDIECQPFPADWDKYGKAAGYKRNKQMLDEGQPDWVIAFPGGPGTKMMIELAKRNKTKVKIIDYMSDSLFT